MNFQNKPFGVFYNKNPDKKEIEQLKKNKVVFLFLDPSNLSSNSDFFKTFDPVIYFNAGAWENFRKYKKEYPKNAIGKTMIGWEDEKWLDIKNPNVLACLKENIEATIRPYLKNDWRPKIDLDNLDAYQRDKKVTGFSISKNDTINYINDIVNWFKNTFPGGEVCIRNSSEIFSKVKANAILSEQALEDGFVSKYKSATTPIYDIEYYDSGVKAFVGQKVCKDYQGKNQNVRFIGADDDLNTNFFNI